MVQPGRPIEKEDVLLLETKRVTHRIEVASEGSEFFLLFYASRSLRFPIPELLSFAQTLIKQERFSAGSAMEWARDGSYPWEDVRAILQVLLNEQILTREGCEVAEPENPHAPTLPAVDPAKPALEIAPLWHSIDELCALLTLEHDHSVEPAVLELFERPLRSASNSDGRQVWENNVPAALRLPVPTVWKTCTFPGSRYKAQQPMNVSALKQMHAQRERVVAGFSLIRREFMARRPTTSSVRLTVGELYLLAACITSAPSYSIRRRVDPVKGGNLPSWAASMSSSAEGLSKTLWAMLAMADQSGFECRSVPTVDEVYRFTEENMLFYSASGVCAGTRRMIETDIAALVEGDKMLPVDGEVRSFIGDTAACVNYGLVAAVQFARRISLAMSVDSGCKRLRRSLEQLSAPTSFDRQFTERLTARPYERWSTPQAEKSLPLLTRYAEALLGDGLEMTAYREPTPSYETTGDVCQKLADFVDPALRQSGLSATAHTFLLREWILEIGTEYCALIGFRNQQGTICAILDRIDEVRPLNSADATVMMRQQNITSLRTLVSSLTGLDANNDDCGTSFRRSDGSSYCIPGEVWLRGL